MSCGVNIPLSSVVEAIVNDYADVFVGEILKRVSLNNSTINNGTLTDVTIRGGLTLDNAAKGALCTALQDCIAAKIQSELGCERDNYVTDFVIDKVNDRITITMKFGEKHHISKSELKEWIGAIGDKDTNTYPTHGEVVNNTTVRIHLNTGGYVDIDASTLVPKNSPFIVSGVFVSRDGGYWLDFTRNDNTKVKVDMTTVIGELVNTLRTQILGMGYTLKTENNHYTTQAEDFNGFTIIRANRNGDQTITITKPDDSFIGKALIVRKTNGDVGTFVTIKAGDGVTISPPDATPLRRVGISATLVYTGDGNWDVFGELP